MGNSNSNTSLPPPPPPISLDQFKSAFDPQSNGVAASVAKTNADSAAAFTTLGNQIKDSATDTAYKVKDISLDAGDKLKWAFTNDQAMDVYKSTANSLSVVASTLTGIPIDTGYNSSSVPNFGRIQANNSSTDNSSTNAPPSSGVAPLTQQPLILPDNQVFETSIYNPYNTTTPTDQQQSTNAAAIDPSVYAVLAIPAAAVLMLVLLRR